MEVVLVQINFVLRFSAVVDTMFTQIFDIDMQSHAVCDVQVHVQQLGGALAELSRSFCEEYIAKLLMMKAREETIFEHLD